MKRLLFIIGTFAMMLLLLGFLFRIMAYQGSGLLVLAGLLIFTLVLAIGAIKQRNLMFYSGFISFILLLFAWIFDKLDLPGADLFFIAGILVIILIVLPIFGFWLYKHS